MKWQKKTSKSSFCASLEKEKKKTPSCKNSPQRKIIHATLVLF
jgi:hypothetical protein